MRKLKVGIIGVGFISRMHLEGYQKLDEVETCAFCDIIPERAEQGAEKYGCPGARVYTDYKKMLAEERLDIVSVCTENNMHAEISIAAMEAGCHVLCEKPMAITSAEADAMVEASRRTGRKLSVGYQLRFLEDALYLKKEIDKGRLGRVYYAEAEAIRRRGVPTWGVFLDKEKQGGGPLIDIGTHVVDLALWLMDDYSPVVSAICSTYDKLIPKGGYNSGGHWDIDSFEVEDSAFGLVTLKSGATLVVKASWALNVKGNGRNGTLLCGVDGGAELNFGENTLVINGEAHDRLWESSPTAASASKKGSPYDREIEAWVDAIIHDKEPVVKCEQAAQVVYILEALYRSAKLGKALNL